MTRNGHGEGTIRQREDGRWEARLTLGIVNGKPKRKSFYGKTRAEVRKKLTAARRTLDLGMVLVTERKTLALFLDDWLTTVAKQNVRATTYRSYEQLIRVHLKPTLGHHQLEKLQPQHVQVMLNDKRQSGLSPRTVQYLRALLRRALGQALKWDLVTRNVATLVDPPRSVPHEIKPFTSEQADMFLAAARGDRLEALYCVALALGMRKGEILGLRWDDVDWEGGQLLVRVQLQSVGGKATLVDLKTDSSRRTLPLPARLATTLRAHRTRQREKRLLAGGRWQDHGLVFASTIGTPLDPRKLTTRYKALLSTAGLPDVRFHDLRHSCATFLLAQGIQARVVMAILGYSQISLTMNTYAHVQPEMQEAAKEAMDRLLRSA